MAASDTGLLVVADFDTPSARAIGLITAHRRRGESVYRVVGHSDDLTNVTAAAAAVVAERTGSSR